MPAAVREYFARIGKMYGAAGGRATAAKLSPRKRKANARKAARARWAKTSKARKS